MEFSLIADGNAKSYWLWETIGQFLIKLNMDLLYDQKFSLVYLTQKMKSYVHIKTYMLLMFVVLVVYSF